MSFNGYAYFNDQNFLDKNNKPCYIPENADNSLINVYSYQDLVKTVKWWLSKDRTIKYIEETKKETLTVEDWVNNLYEDFEYQSPLAKLKEYSYQKSAKNKIKKQW